MLCDGCQICENKNKQNFGVFLEFFFKSLQIKHGKWNTNSVMNMILNALLQINQDIYIYILNNKSDETRDNGFFFKKAEVIQKITKKYIRKDYHVQL